MSNRLADTPKRSPPIKLSITSIGSVNASTCERLSAPSEGAWRVNGGGRYNGIYRQYEKEYCVVAFHSVDALLTKMNTVKCWLLISMATFLS